jgi:hypothetical protein
MIKSEISGIGKWSKALIEVICDDCGLQKSIAYKLYTSYGYSDGEYFCKKCKLKKNNLEKWGVENPFQLDIVKEKIKKTNLEKWGVENPSQNVEINKKVRESISKLDKESVNKKRESTNLEKWGVKNVSQSEEIKGKKEETNIKNWGSSNNKKSESFRKGNFNIAKDKNYIKYLQEGKSLFNCDCDENHNFEIDIDVYSKRVKWKTIICTECNPINKHQSGKEILLLNYIKSIYSGEVVQNFRIERMEIDIYLPQLNLGFEFNGVWWHSDEYKRKSFHLDKTNFFTKREIKLIHIWEDDWDIKSDIIKSQIKNWLGLSNRIWARNCHVKEVTVSDSIEFLNKNHIQGGIGSNLKLGLYYKNELISLMTFDNLEGRKRMTTGNWNINRFCNKLGSTVVGGASKIFKYFIKNYEVKRVISYSDKDWSTGGLYEKLKFTKISENSVDYKYVVDGKRVHKSNFKGIEKEIPYPKIWDCGKIKWEIII